MHLFTQLYTYFGILAIGFILFLSDSQLHNGYNHGKIIKYTVLGEIGMFCLFKFLQVIIDMTSHWEWTHIF